MLSARVALLGLVTPLLSAEAIALQPDAPVGVLYRYDAERDRYIHLEQAADNLYVPNPATGTYGLASEVTGAAEEETPPAKEAMLEAATETEDTVFAHPPIGVLYKYDAQRDRYIHLEQAKDNEYMPNPATGTYGLASEVRDASLLEVSSKQVPCANNDCGSKDAKIAARNHEEELEEMAEDESGYDNNGEGEGTKGEEVSDMDGPEVYGESNTQFSQLDSMPDSQIPGGGSIFEQGGGWNFSDSPKHAPETYADDRR